MTRRNSHRGGLALVLHLIVVLYGAQGASSVQGSLLSRFQREAEPQGSRSSGGGGGGGGGSKTPFTLQDIVDDEYSADRWNGTWVSDTEFAYRKQEGDLALLNIVDQKSQILVPAEDMLQPERVFKFWVSPDKLYVMLAIRPQKLFRHSFIAMYDVYNVRTGERTRLQPSNLPPFDFGGADQAPDDGGQRASGPQGPPPGSPRPRGPPPQLPLMYATWSPTGHALAYVFANNIFFRESPTSPDVTLTTSGKDHAEDKLWDLSLSRPWPMLQISQFGQGILLGLDIAREKK